MSTAAAVVAMEGAEGAKGTEKIHKRRNGENGGETEKTYGLAPRVAQRRADLRSAPEPEASHIRQVPLRALPMLDIHNRQNLLRFASVPSVSPFVNLLRSLRPLRGQN